MKEEKVEEQEVEGRVKHFRSRSDFHLSLLWTLLGTGAILYWDGFGRELWQCFVAIGIVAALVHRSIWVGIFSFLGVAILWTILVWILLLSTT